MQAYRLWCGCVARALTVACDAVQLRSALMPINDKYNLATVLEACEEYQSAPHAFVCDAVGRSCHHGVCSRHAGSRGAGTGNRHIVFEYVMMQGVNDSLDQAREVAALIQGPNRILSLL